MITRKGTIIKINTFNTEGNFSLQVIAKAPISSFCLKIAECNTDRTFFITSECDSNCANYSFKIDKPLLWNIDEPNLYDFDLIIKGNNFEEQICDSFAFRTISVSGNDILLNGKPIFIRGYIRGAKAHEHDNNCGLTESEFYAKNISEAKKFGFNFVRFHSVIPNEAFFKEADRLGVLVHIELRLPTDSYNNLEEMVNAQNSLIADDFILTTINSLYNHPSLCVYCIGNEIKNYNLESRIEEIGKLIKETDSSRLYIDTCAWGKFNRKYVDIDVQHMGYYFPFGKHNEMFSDANSIHILKSMGVQIKDGENPYKIPLIAHEICHYTALRDFNGLKNKFMKYNKEEPWWINEELKMIESKGFSCNYKELYDASKYFQLQCWKVAFENLRLSKLLSGFHFLQFADTDVYENSNGVVDCFDDENYVSSATFKEFNDDIVLLSSLKERLFTSNEEIDFNLYVSNYGSSLYENATLVFSLTDGENLYLSQEYKGLKILKYGINELLLIGFRLPEIMQSKKLIISVCLKNGEQIIAANKWNIWAFKKQNKLQYNDFICYYKNGVLITDNIARALKGVKEKKKVCLIYRSDWTRHVSNKNMYNPEYAFRATWNRFKPVIWDRGTNFGGLCDCDLLTKYGFVSDRFYDFNYSVITEDCDKIILDDFPIKVKSLISGTDKNVRDRFDASKNYFNLSELQYDRTLRNFSYLFEFTIDNSPVLVCGLNLKGLDNDEPSTLNMAQFILDYMQSADFAPVNNISLSAFTKYLSECAKTPVKERMMTQFWELDNAPVESKAYWEESKEYLIKS